MFEYSIDLCSSSLPQIHLFPGYVSLLRLILNLRQHCVRILCGAHWSVAHVGRVHGHISYKHLLHLHGQVEHRHCGLLAALFNE